MWTDKSLEFICLKITPLYSTLAPKYLYGRFHIEAPNIDVIAPTCPRWRKAEIGTGIITKELDSTLSKAEGMCAWSRNKDETVEAVVSLDNSTDS